MMRYLQLSLAILLMGTLCGCPPPADNTQGNTNNNTNQNGKPQKVGGTVRLPLEIAWDDPDLQAMNFSEQRLWALSRAIAPTLMQADCSTQEVQPGVALSAVASKDWLSWTLTLQPAAGHTDDPQWLGREYASLFKRIVNGQKSPLRAEILDLVAGAREFSKGAADISGISVADNEISFTLNRPNAGFDLWLSQPGLGLAEVSLGTEDAPAASSTGFGAWRIDRLEQSVANGGSELVLLPNPDSLVGKPAADELHFILEPDRAKQVELFRAGRLDAAGIPTTMLPKLQQDAELSGMLQQHESAVALLVLFDHGQDPWGDQVMQDKAGLRQSLGLSLSRESLQEENNGQISGWGHFLPQCYRDSISPNLLTSPLFPQAAQLEEARLKQKESDHEQGTHLPLNMDVAYLEYDNLEALDRDLLQFWSDISIRLQPFALSHSELLRRIDLNSHEVIVFWNYPAWPDPEACLYPQLMGSLIGEGGNYSRIDNPEINGLLADAQQESDPALRRLKFQRINEIIEEQGLFVPVGYASPTLLLRSGLNITPGLYDFNASLQGQDFRAIGFSQP